MTVAKLTIADAFSQVLDGDLPLRFTAYDGSASGAEDAPFGLDLKNERGLAYLMTAPGDLGLGRAYVSGDLDVSGVHPGDPYEALKALQAGLRFKIPSPALAIKLATGLGLSHLKPPTPPKEETLPRWRRVVEGVRHSRLRDKEAIHHHYDVSNAFYEYVLGPSMTYTCAVYPTDEATLEQAQYYKYDLIAKKLDLQPGMRLLDVGCGWGGMVRHAAEHYGVKTLGVTLSREQATWAQEKIKEMGLDHLAEVRHSDYREVTESDFDAVSSIGLTEHIGVRNYASYFGFLRDRLRPQGRLLNHCITRPHNKHQETGAFIDRFVFPDGELTGSGRIITEVQNVGLEVMHEENFRVHYARTLAGWCANLVENWDACVDEVGEGTARVWGLYMAGSRLGFERNEIQLHHVLATKTDPNGEVAYPLRPTFAGDASYPA
jgi:cyclopropane-fatty-acyl-phospholipid synthase